MNGSATTAPPEGDDQVNGGSNAGDDWHDIDVVAEENDLAAEVLDGLEGFMPSM